MDVAFSINVEDHIGFLDEATPEACRDMMMHRVLVFDREGAPHDVLISNLLYGVLVVLYMINLDAHRTVTCEIVSLGGGDPDKHPVVLFRSTLHL